MKQKTLRQRRFYKDEPKKIKISLSNIFFPFVCFISLLLIILFVDPSTFGIVPFFFLLIFIFLFFFLSNFIKNLRRKLLISGGVVLFLILKYFGMGNFINFFLLLGIIITIETYYEWYSKKTD